MQQELSASKPPTLILLPGLDGTGILFRPLLAALPQTIRSRVIAYPADQRLSLAEHAQVVVQQLPHEDVVLLAESFSGLIALMLLAQGTPRIKGVLFIASFAEPPRPLLLRLATRVPWVGSVTRGAPSFLLRQFCLGRGAGDGELALLREALGAVSPEVVAHRLGLISERHPLEKEHFDAPCGYLQANQDRLVPPAAARWFQKHFEACDVASVEGPHFLLQVKPLQCAEWIEKKLLGF